MHQYAWLPFNLFPGNCCFVLVFLPFTFCYSFLPFFLMVVGVMSVLIPFWFLFISRLGIILKQCIPLKTARPLFHNSRHFLYASGLVRVNSCSLCPPQSSQDSHPGLMMKWKSSVPTATQWVQFIIQPCLPAPQSHTGDRPAPTARSLTLFLISWSRCNSLKKSSFFKG